MIKEYWPHFLLFIYIVTFVFCSINPISLDVWLDKNIISVIIVIFFVVLNRKGVHFSNTGYTMAFVFPLVNTLAAHYGYGDNTIGVFNNTISVQGDIFEKLIHFSSGFYAYPLIGYLIKAKKIRSKWLTILFSIFIVGFITMDYEIIEIFTAIKSGTIDALTITSDSFGVFYVQGDIFIGTLGALFASIVYMFNNRK